MGIIFIIAGLRFLPDAFTSTINAVGAALWITTGIGIIAARKWIQIRWGVTLFINYETQN